MATSRRALLRMSALLIPTVAVTACANLPAGTNVFTAPVKVTLAVAKMWSSELVAALTDFAAVAVAASGNGLTADAKSTIQQLVATLQGADHVFQGMQDGTTTVSNIVNEILNGVREVTPLIPGVPVPVKAAVELGVAILQAFLTSAEIVVPPVPVALHQAAEHARKLGLVHA